MLSLIWTIVWFPIEFLYEKLIGERRHEKWVNDNKPPWTDGTW